MACSKEESWQCMRSFEETNWHMLQDEKLCDVTFLVGSSKKEEVKAHKFILASRSPVFFAMFCGSLPETSETIEVPDIEPFIFRDLLRFIYTEDITVNENNTMALLYCAKKYEVKRLNEACQTFLSTNICPDNVFTILQHAIQFDEDDLVHRCLTYVKKNAERVLKSDVFPKISKEVLKKLIESDDLFANELTVYDACKRWAKAQCELKPDHTTSSEKELRRELGDIIYSVRFSTMSLQAFTENVATEDLLTPEEKVVVYKLISGLDSKKIPEALSFPFKSRNRKLHTEIVELKRFGTTNYGGYGDSWSYRGKPDILDFTVSVPCMLLGIYLFSPICEGSIEGEISLHKGTSEVESYKNIRINYETSKYYEKVLFDKPVGIEPGTKYTIYVILRGVNTFYGNVGQSKVISGPLEVVFLNNDQHGNGTNAERGQIPSVIFEFQK